MKYYTISFPGECGQDVVETWTEKQILSSSWYKNWVLRMCQNNLHDKITNENAIDDWCAVHWAEITEKEE